MLSIRYLYTTGLYEAGANLFATIERLSDGYYWDTVLGDFAVSPSMNDRAILLDQRAEDAYASIYEADVINMGSPGAIEIYIHDADLTGELAIDHIEAYVQNSEQVTLLDILAPAALGAINPLAIIRPVSQIIVIGKSDIGPSYSNAQAALDNVSSALVPYRARVVRNYLERGELHIEVTSPLNYQADVAKAVRALYPTSRDNFNPPPDIP